MFPCKHCAKVYKSSHAMYNHVRIKHTSIEVTKVSRGTKRSANEASMDLIDEEEFDDDDDSDDDYSDDGGLAASNSAPAIPLPRNVHNKQLINKLDEQFTDEKPDTDNPVILHDWALWKKAKKFENLPSAEEFLSQSSKGKVVEDIYGTRQREIYWAMSKHGDQDSETYKRCKIIMQLESDATKIEQDEKSGLDTIMLKNALLNKMSSDAELYSQEFLTSLVNELQALMDVPPCLENHNDIQKIVQDDSMKLELGKVLVSNVTNLKQVLHDAGVEIESLKVKLANCEVAKSLIKRRLEDLSRPIAGYMSYKDVCTNRIHHITSLKNEICLRCAQSGHNKASCITSLDKISCAKCRVLGHSIYECNKF